jgi:hypothetical protein
MTFNDSITTTIEACCNHVGIPYDTLLSNRSYLGSIVKESTIIINAKWFKYPVSKFFDPLNLKRTQALEYVSMYSHDKSTPLALNVANSVMKEMLGPSERNMALLKAVIQDKRLDLSPSQLLTLQTIIKENL